MEKKVLKIFLFLFFVFSVFEFFNDFSVKLPYNLNNLGPSYLSVAYILAFCFAYQNGDEGVGKAGIILVILSLILKIIIFVFGTKLLINHSTLLLWISRIIGLIASINSLLYFIVLFNLIDSDDNKVILFKIGTILFSIIFILMNILSYIFFKLSINATFLKVQSFMNHLLFLTEYSVFFFYLIIRNSNDNFVYVEPKVDNTPVGNVVPNNSGASPANGVIGNAAVNINNSNNLASTTVQNVASVAVSPSINNATTTNVQSNINNQITNMGNVNNSISSSNMQQSNDSSLEDFMNLPNQSNTNNNNNNV